MKIYVNKFPENKEIPWYLKHFVLFVYKDHSIEIGFTVPFKFWGEIIWFAFPKWMFNRQMSECINYIPDYRNKDGGYGEKLKPFLGHIIDLEEGAMVSWNWWKHLKKYKIKK